MNLLVVNNLYPGTWRKCCREVVISGMCVGATKSLQFHWFNHTWLLSMSYGSHSPQVSVGVSHWLITYLLPGSVATTLQREFGECILYLGYLLHQWHQQGHLCIKATWNRFRGNMIIWGRKLPAAFMQQRVGVFCPCSTDASRTCLTHFVAITFPGCTTVLTPVSSQFQMLVALKLPFLWVSSNM